MKNMPRCNTLQHTATHCNTLQHTATHCNTLQHIANISHLMRQRHTPVGTQRVKHENKIAINAKSTQYCLSCFSNLAKMKLLWALCGITFTVAIPRPVERAKTDSCGAQLDVSAHSKTIICRPREAVQKQHLPNIHM